MHDPATQDFWTMCGSEPCSQLWGGTTLSYWFNFSNPRLVNWWLNVYIGAAVNNSAFDGIYFDCQCDWPPGVAHADQFKFQLDAQAAFDRALALLQASGKWASSWGSDGHITQATCQSVLARWIAIGADEAHAHCRSRRRPFKRTPVYQTPAKRTTPSPPSCLREAAPR
eukprot:7037267-Prymnesium_polylepis.2